MAVYPTGKKDFVVPVDNESDIEAVDIITLQQELRAVIDFHGTVSKTQNIGFNTMLLDYRQPVAINTTVGDTVQVPAQRMMIDQRAVVNTVDITLDLDGNIDGSGASSTSTTYYVYVVDDNVAAGTFSMKFRTSNADNFTSERKIGSVTTAATGTPPDVAGITDDDIATAIETKLVKGWIAFNGTGTIAELDAFNVASIGDIGTGNYTITWDVDFATSSYPASVTPNTSSTMGSTGTMAAGSMTCWTFLDTGSAIDTAHVSIIAIGDQ